MRQSQRREQHGLLYAPELAIGSQQCNYTVGDLDNITFGPDVRSAHSLFMLSSKMKNVSLNFVSLSLPLS